MAFCNNRDFNIKLQIFKLFKMKITDFMIIAKSHSKAPFHIKLSCFNKSKTHSNPSDNLIGIFLIFELLFKYTF